MTSALRMEGVLPRGSVVEWTQPADFAIAEGTFFVIRTTPGRAGATVRMMLGLEEATAGSVETLGEPLQDASRSVVERLRRAVGSVLQPDGLLGTFSVEANLALAASARGGLRQREAEDAAREMLARCGVPGAHAQRPAALAPDVRQTAALARALIGSPRLLLLDDPVAAVKSRSAVALYRLCRDVAPTVVILTHRRNDVLYDVADEVALWDDRGFRTDHAA